MWEVRRFWGKCSGRVLRGEQDCGSLRGGFVTCVCSRDAALRGLDIGEVNFAGAHRHEWINAIRSNRSMDSFDRRVGMGSPVVRGDSPAVLRVSRELDDGLDGPRNSASVFGERFSARDSVGDQAVDGKTGSQVPAQILEGSEKVSLGRIDNSDVDVVAENGVSHQCRDGQKAAFGKSISSEPDLDSTSS